MQKGGSSRQSFLERLWGEAPRYLRCWAKRTLCPSPRKPAPARPGDLPSHSQEKALLPGHSPLVRGRATCLRGRCDELGGVQRCESLSSVLPALLLSLTVAGAQLPARCSAQAPACNPGPGHSGQALPGPVWRLQTLTEAEHELRSVRRFF